ncbi:hypothetical protein [Streptomyces sp. NPDC005752]|uniref:hypothetical protein n=1 Tax=Streptomyces sp. NPDC005752 TaxID=3157065 RepID=UPI003401126E
MLLVPFSVHDHSYEIACDAPVFYESEGTPYSQGAGKLCSAERDWPELLAIGLLAVPPAIAGAALFTSGSARKRSSARVFAVLEMQKSEERARRKTRPDSGRRAPRPPNSTWHARWCSTRHQRLNRRA